MKSQGLLFYDFYGENEFVVQVKGQMVGSFLQYKYNNWDFHKYTFLVKLGQTTIVTGLIRTKQPGATHDRPKVINKVRITYFGDIQLDLMTYQDFENGLANLKHKAQSVKSR